MFSNSRDKSGPGDGRKKEFERSPTAIGIKKCRSTPDIGPAPAIQKQLYSMFQQCFARRRAKLAPAEGASHFLRLAQQTADSLFLHDACGRVIDANQRACDALGYSRAELLGLRLADIDARAQQHDMAGLMARVSRNRTVLFKSRYRRRDGSLFPVEIRVSCTRLHGRAHLLAQVRDLSMDADIGKRLRYLIHHDHMTGLLNRRAFFRRLRHALSRAQQHGEGLALLVIDIDRFKRWNEAFGHAAGDRLLREVALRLQAALPAGGLIARTGGNEFAVLLDDASCIQQLALARAMLNALQREFDITGQPHQISARMGMAIYPEDGRDQGELLSHALGAMHGAKSSGRERLRRHAVYNTPCPHSAASLESALSQAARRGELELHYQAKVDARSNRVSGCEALLRWRHPEHGLLLPERFIPLAEETGLIVPLTRWVLHDACSQMQRWHAQGLAPDHVAVNLSAGPFIEAGLLEDVRDALEHSGMDPARLELEITESLMVRGIEDARTILAGLKRFGVRIAIDDFGIGYSSLSQLKNLPIDIIKIDRAFITDVPGSRVDEAIATAIIAMGKSLRAAVVAEGVEEAAQLDFLRALGCDHIQGYYFSKPAPADQFEEWLRNGPPLALRQGTVASH